MIKKTLSLVALSLITVASTSASYEEISCDTDSVFGQNSCDQCFTGGAKSAGDNIGFLSDLWVNNSGQDHLVLKDEQEMPKMVDLSGGNTLWSQTPSSLDFWEYTEEFDALYSEDDDAYILENGEQVTWIQSKFGYAYSVEANTTPSGENSGLLVYTLVSHALTADGGLDMDGTEHKECVLFTSGAPTEEPEVATPKEEPKELPQTGAEHVLLLLIALLATFGIYSFRKSRS